MTTDSPGVAGMETRARVDRYLTDAGVAAHVVRVVPLTGDASDRRYLRVLLDNGPSQVLAVHPQAIAFEQLPFVNVAHLLEAMPVPVPAILGHSDALGIIALEDLGDVTLQAHLGVAAAAEHAALYRQAVSIIETMQRRGAELASADYVPYGIAFDEPKLMWELDFFAAHFLEAYRGAVIGPAAREAIAAEFAALAAELAAEARVLCHRDYHSRNLMLHEGRLFVIDFQDARLGPDTYDLVSLLRDSYIDLTDAQVDEYVAYFLALRGQPAGDTDATDTFRRRFDVMALQRNLKALGTFGFQTTTRGNPVYIQYIPRTLQYVRRTIDRQARFGRLRDLLADHLDELR